MTEPSQTQQQGHKGFELDIYLRFVESASEQQVSDWLRPLLAGLDESRQLELYRPVPATASVAMDQQDQQELSHQAQQEQSVQALRLTGPASDGTAQTCKKALAELILGPCLSIEIGLRGFLRSKEGYTEWMPWRRNQLVPFSQASLQSAIEQIFAQVQLSEGVKYILEHPTTN